MNGAKKKKPSFLSRIGRGFSEYLCSMDFHTGPIYSTGYPLVTAKKNKAQTPLKSLYFIRKCKRCREDFSRSGDRIWK